MKPLTGTRVVEIGRFVTAPLAAQMLADLGADVVKIEDPDGGDPFRGWERDWGGGGYGPPFLAFNRGKRSLTLDLRSKDARGIVKRLAKTADVFIENFRPGVTERLGIGCEALSAENPRLIYCGISGLGKDGPLAQYPGYDVVGQGMSGLMGQLVDLEDPRPVGPVFSDTLTAMTAAYGILGALQARERTGEGQRVETSLLHATMSFLNQSFTSYLASGKVHDASQRARASGVFSFLGSDGLPFVVQLSSPVKFWRSFVQAAGHPEMTEDPRFKTHEDRHRNWALIHEALKPTFAGKPRAEWLDILRRAEVPVAPIYRLDEAVADPQVQHLDMVQSAVHPEKGTVRVIGPGIRLSGTPLGPIVAPPVLGEHTDALLAELGYGADQIRQWRADGTLEHRKEGRKA